MKIRLQNLWYMLHYILSRITAKRIEKNFSQRYMAARLNISQSYYNKLENGRNEMSIKTLLEIIEILDIGITDLFNKDKSA